MKTIIRIAAITIIGLSLSNCAIKEESPDIASPVSTELVFTATREAVSPDTKTVRKEDGAVWWSPSEEVSVFNGSGSDGGDKLVSTNTAVAQTVELSGAVHVSGSGKAFWAVLPYSPDNSCDGSSVTMVIPSAQEAVDGNFSNNVFPAIARSTSLNLPFWNVCGGVKFSVSRTDIESITFKGNNGETLAGKVKVVFNAGSVPEVIEVLDGKSEITLTAPEGGCFKADEFYYITCLPSLLESGFSISFATSTKEGSVVSNNPQTIKRSIFGLLKNIDSKVAEWKTTWAEPEAVDLGLSVKWASFNLGATKPEEYGDYFSWGEVEPNSHYSWSYYKFGSYGSFRKYNSQDGLTQLELEDDAAYVNLGGNWRMPTHAEELELSNNCSSESCTINGIKGYRFVAVNGNEIFFPFGGLVDGTDYACNDTDVVRIGEGGWYWSSTLNSLGSGYAQGLCFWPSLIYYVDHERCDGHMIRPVYDDRIHPESVSLNKSTLSLSVGVSEQLIASVLPDNATDKSLTWSSDNTNVAAVDSAGNVTAIAAGSATITVTTTDGAKTATCKVTVVDVPKPEAIDLGLPSGLKWASFNVGATKPEDYGDYFAWGETEPKTNYSWLTYKWCSGSKNTLTRYCPSDKKDYWGSSGTPDGKTEFKDYGYEDDTARSIFGEDWRMPTYAEWDELFDKCTLTWTTQNGVKGCLITGPNGNSIFLPAAGERYNTYNYFVDTSCLYWSSSINAENPSIAFGVLLESGIVNWNHESRFDGQSVRPVYDDRILPESISLNKSRLSLSAGASEQLIATVLPDNASVKSVSWSSDNAGVATVDNDGNVYANRAGVATITATTTLCAKMSTCEVIVNNLDLSLPASVEANDLGLPSGLKWASCNIGATKPEERGEFFAWGETQPKGDYCFSTYSFKNSTDYSFTKYVTNSSNGVVDNNAYLDPEDDAACVNWGGNWRMPTNAEWVELLNHCSWIWITQNGVKGRLVIGSNGHSIFLPAAGNVYDTYPGGAGSYGNYWSSSLCMEYPGSAYGVYFNGGEAYRDYCFRYLGQSIRPVYDDRIHPESVSLNKSTLSLLVGHSEQLIAAVSPDNATLKSVVWSSDNTEVAMVDENGNVTALKIGTAKITVTTTLGGLTATCEVTVKPDYNGHEYVDLGLPSGLKWASMNVGATKPEEYGEYFAWGETKPKSYYSWSTYKWCNGADDKLTKYCDQRSYWDSTEPMDNKTVLDLEDDAAHVNWGGSWRMPTEAEWGELMNNCSWAWISRYGTTGVSGYIVSSIKIGYTDKSIFLPAAGFWFDAIRYYAGSVGYYWSSSLNTYYQTFNALYVNFESVVFGFEGNGSERCYGLSVRPVSE